jgi:hypothetical protein
VKYLVSWGEVVSARDVKHAIRLAASRLEAMPCSELEEQVADAIPLPKSQQAWPTSQRVRNRQAKAKLFVERSGLRYPDHGIDD